LTRVVAGIPGNVMSSFLTGGRCLACRHTAVLAIGAVGVSFASCAIEIHDACGTFCVSRFRWIRPGRLLPALSAVQLDGRVARLTGNQPRNPLWRTWRYSDAGVLG